MKHAHTHTQQKALKYTVMQNANTYTHIQIHAEMLSSLTHRRIYGLHSVHRPQHEINTRTHSSHTVSCTKLLHIIEAKPDVSSYLSVPL